MGYFFKSAGSAQEANKGAYYEYTPFGGLVLASGGSLGASGEENSFRFSTKYHDPETGFYYYGYRHYNASLGRWLNRDPIEEQGGLNLYAFAGNNGIDAWDLLGMTVCESDELLSPEAEEVIELIADLVGYGMDIASVLMIIADILNTPISPTPDLAIAAMAMQAGKIGAKKMLMKALRGTLRAAFKTAKSIVSKAKSVLGKIKSAAAKAKDLGRSAKDKAKSAWSWLKNKTGFGDDATNKVKGPPKPSPKFKPPTNPPQNPPKDIPDGWRVREMPSTQQYPDGYWKLEKPMKDGSWQPIDPSTMKPGGRPETHIPFPTNQGG